MTFLMLAGLGAIAAPARARLVEDQQIWTNITAIGTIGPRLAYFVEVQPRTADGVGRVGQLILRPAIGWKFSPAVTVYGGYARIINEPRNGRQTHEDRAFAQLSWDLGRVAGGRLSSRSRLERRAVSNGRGVAWRAREMLRYVHPLTMPDRPRLLISEELLAHLNDTDWGTRAGFDQARTFAGLEFPLGAAKSTVEAGYLNQTINDPRGQVRMNHVASVTFFIRP